MVYTVEGNSGDALTISWTGQKETRGQSSGCSFALHIPFAVPAMIVSSASSKKHPIDCVRLFFLPKFMRYNVVVNIYGCRLVIVLIDGYNIMVCWAVRYIWIYGSTGKRKNRTYHFGGYGGYLKKSDWGRNKHLSDMAYSERYTKACWYSKKSRNLTTFWLLSFIIF